jgi:hypothetical protein
LSATGNVYATSLFTPVVGSLAGNYLAGQILSSSILDLTGTSTISYTIGNVGLVSTSAVSFTYPSPANIAGILKTTVVYYSTENGASTVYVSYYVTDAFGRSQCSPSGVTVSLNVGAASSACSVFASAAAPYGTCSLIVNPAVFSSSASAVAVSVSLSVSSVVVQTT